ncbi:MAG: 30S ribosomal protein S11 [Candidatus Gracilibacteria bacterium]|jgi:small subunit ribosomal protein S11
MADKETKGKGKKVEAKDTKSEEKDGKKVKKSKTKRRSIPQGNAYIHASYNNTIVTLTEPNGDTIAWASSGGSGFKGTRKSTPYAAQVAAEKAVEKAKIYGLAKVHVFVNGAGPGRDQSIRGLVGSGIDVISISDITPIPHNGCRKRKPRRV